ncbi:hypothetical protein [Actinoplanes sp. NPDC049316]|uniref:hypothetical protein n=1 Tax=Actinoplanes sp. NPDC049316 TaxID=3154727 RepID=UPI003423EA74
MQPTNPPAQPAPPPSTPAAAPPKQRNRRTRLIVAMAGGILALLCLGGVGVFISFYDEATKIERKNPDIVVSSYLRAYLVNRNDQEASLYTCKSGGDLAGMSALRDEMANREKEFDVTVSVNWGSLSVSQDGQGRSVSTELTIVGSSNGQSVSQRTDAWRFGLVDEDGWRVCSATKVS